MHQLALRITHLITFRHLTKPLIKGYHSRPSEVKIAWILSIISLIALYTGFVGRFSSARPIYGSPAE
jgi:hypothetical protein